MTTRSALALFTAHLSELVNGGVPVRKSLAEMSVLPGAPLRVRQIARAVGSGVEEGRALSAVLASCNDIVFPAWYTACIGAAEENGCLGETLSYLARTLENRQKAVSAFASALVYPAVVVALCFVCSVWAVVAFPALLSDDSAAYKSAAVGSFVSAGVFLLAVAGLTYLVLRAVMRESPCVSVMSALAFLTEKGTPLRESLAAVVPVAEKEERLCSAVLAIRDALLRGEPLAESFSAHLRKAGFSDAADVVSMHLALAQSGGTKHVFLRTAEILAQKAERTRAMVLSAEQPVLLCCAAIYMLLLLKNTLMPYMTRIGM